jgi:hypothetical protein
LTAPAVIDLKFVCAVSFTCGLVLLGARPVGAAELSLRQPSACQIGDELLHRVERALGQPLAEAAEVRCTVEVLRQRGELTARLAVDSAGSEPPVQQRSFSGRSCEELTDVLAVAVVLAVGAGPSAASPSAAHENPDTPSPAPVPIQEENKAHDTAAASPPEAPLARSSVHAALVLDAGTLPAPGPGALLGGSLGWEQLELRLLGTYLFPRAGSLEASATGSPGAELALLAGGLLGCAPRLVQTWRIELGACAGAELGWLWGSGTGVNAPKDGGGLWSAARGDVGARWGVGPRWLGIDVRVSGHVPFERHRFAITEDGGSRRVHQPGAVVGRLSVGVSVDLD